MKFAFVLHTHLPYVRHNGTWPCGEDFYHQAATESYLPLIAMLQRLEAAGLRNVLTLGITPVLAEQMRDAHMRDELASYIARYELRAMQQVSTYRGWASSEIHSLAAFYARFGRTQMERLESCDGDLTRPFASLSESGVIELIGGPSTHPLLPRCSFADLQLREGLDSHELIFGNRPKGIWIPECAVAPGVSELLARCNVEYSVVDESCGSRVSDGVAFHALDRSVMSVMWTRPDSYPSGPWYRDFHAYDLVAGFKNWRITDRERGWLGKQIYEPSTAIEHAHQDARAFVSYLEKRFRQQEQIVACFDTELFGHWWFEGVSFLEELLTLLASHSLIELVTLGELPTPLQSGELRESTWGENSDFRSWDVPQMWKRLWEAEAETQELMRTEHEAKDLMLRELMLLQSSDWPYLVVKGNNASYAQERFDTHFDRWSWLADAIRYNKDASKLIADLEPIDSYPA
ncbi:MAG: 1,4-alpha-glucan branching protein domain-containing protein [Actinomycetota bacterium]